MAKKKLTLRDIKNLTDEQLAAKLAETQLSISPNVLKAMQKNRRLNFDRWAASPDN